MAVCEGDCFLPGDCSVPPSLCPATLLLFMNEILLLATHSNSPF